MAFLVFMPSNRPDMALASARRYTCFDKLYIYAHEKQKMNFEAAWQEHAVENSNIEFIYHNIDRLVDGQPPFGAIRFHLLSKAQEIIGRRDLAIMVDDDMKQPRWAEPGKFYGGGSQSYPSATPEIFKRELEYVAKEAREVGFYFFTGIPNARGHNSYKREEPFKAVWRFSQLLGFFKNSPNPFNPKIGAGEDYAAACKLVSTLNTLPFLEHRGLCPEIEIISSKYQDPNDTRNIFLKELQKQYPWIEVKNNYVSKVYAPRMNRKFLNMLKRSIDSKYK